MTPEQESIISLAILSCIVGGLLLWRWFVWIMKQEEKEQGELNGKP
jgi:hypothetical protein